MHIDLAKVGKITENTANATKTAMIFFMQIASFNEKRRPPPPRCREQAAQIFHLMVLTGTLPEPLHFWHLPVPSHTSQSGGGSLSLPLSKTIYPPKLPVPSQFVHCPEPPHSLQSIKNINMAELKFGMATWNAKSTSSIAKIFFIQIPPFNKGVPPAPSEVPRAGGAKNFIRNRAYSSENFLVMLSFSSMVIKMCDEFTALPFGAKKRNI